MTWREGIRDLIQYKRSDLDHIYQFGIYLGESLIELKEMYGTSVGGTQKFWAFDSFCGTPNVVQEGQWEPHSFSAQRDTESVSPDQAAMKIIAKLKPHFNGISSYYLDRYLSEDEDNELSIFSGFYSESLKDEIAKEMKPAFYVDVDCDLYSSTVEALDFMFRNKLIVKGSLIGFDDYGGTEKWKTCEDGESRAFAEMIIKYNINTRCIRQFGNEFPHVVRIYEII